MFVYLVTLQLNDGCQHVLMAYTTAEKAREHIEHLENRPEILRLLGIEKVWMDSISVNE